MTNFRVLSIKEENELTLEQKKAYYEQYRQYVLTRKLTNTTPGARFWGPRLKKPTEKIAKSVTKLFAGKDVEWISDGQENLPDGPILFAHTHQGILDNFVWIPTVDRHCLLLHGAEVNKLLLLCQMNTGLVLVKKEDKEHRANSKMDMVRLLLEGHSITYFPEGTWNLSPNKLYLPLSYGFLDIARKAGVPVVPVVHEYTYDDENNNGKIKKIHTRYGKPIYVGIDDDLNEKLEEYETAIATMRFELYEEKGIFNRESISDDEYIRFLENSYKNLALGKLDWPKENRNIFGAHNDFYRYHYINDVPYDESGKLVSPPLAYMGDYIELPQSEPQKTYKKIGKTKGK